MLSIGGPLTSSLLAQQRRLSNSAHNIANLGTEGFRPLRTEMVERPEGGVDAITTRAPAAPPPGGQQSPGSDLVAQLVETIDASNAYAASAAALRRSTDTLGSFIDAFA